MPGMVNKRYSMEEQETGEKLEVETLIHTGLRFVTVTTKGGGVCVQLMPAMKHQNRAAMGFVRIKGEWVLKMSKNPDNGPALLEFPCDAELAFATEKEAQTYISEHAETTSFCIEPMELSKSCWLVGKRDQGWLTEHCLKADANCKLIFAPSTKEKGGKSAKPKRAYLRQIRDIKVGERLRWNYSDRHRSMGKLLGTLPQQLKCKGRGGKAKRAGAGRPSKLEDRRRK